MLSKKNSFLLMLALSPLLLFAQASADHLTVFPKGELGNGLYLNKKWLYSKPSATIYDGLYISALGLSLVYEGEAAGSKKITVIPASKANSVVFAGSNLARLSAGSEFSFIFPLANDSLYSVNLPFISSQGFVDNGRGRVAFFHLERIDADAAGDPLLLYRLHYIDTATKAVVTLKQVVSSGSELKTISWIENGLELKFSTGITRSILIS